MRQTEETKHYIYQLRQKLTKAQNGKQNESKVPSGELKWNENQSKKICWEERKERKERKNRYAKLNRARQRRFIYIKN